MPAGAASKRTKKSPDDEVRVRRKKTKSSSDKHRRRASSHSSSSDDDDTRARTKASKRDSKKRRRRRRSPSCERKKTKKSDKKKPRKSRRRSPSVSSDSGSCSTCRSSSSTGGSELARSRSPGDRYKTKARGRGRDRDRSRKSRYRSPSCSTCSEDSSRSRSRGRKHHAGRPESKAVDKKERRYGSRDGGRDKIIRAYDDFRPSGSNDGYVSARKQDSGITTSDKKGKEGASSKADIKNHKKYEDDGYDSREISAEPTKPTRKRDYDSREISAEPTKSTKKRAEAASSKISTQPANNAYYDDGYDPRRLEYGTAKDLSLRKHSEVVVGSGSHASEHAEVSVTDLAKSEAQDLELILRQRALENFKKFRAGIASKTISLGDQKDKAVGNPSHENVRDSTNSTEGEDCPIGVRLKSIASVVISNPNDNVSSELVGDHMVISSKDDQKTQHQVKRVREPRNKASLEQSALTKDVQDRRYVSGPGSSNPHEPEVNRAGGSASGTSFLKMETTTDKTTAEGGGGDQFEQKTFSTMHAGEMVQVSYKVYIPKKVPALARRQQRR